MPPANKAGRLLPRVSKDSTRHMVDEARAARLSTPQPDAVSRRMNASAILLLALALAACGGEPSPAEPDPIDLEPLVLTVGPGITPVISWTGGSAASVSVTEGVASGKTTKWSFSSQDLSGGLAATRVTYGIVPPDAYCAGANRCLASPLFVGRTYQAAVTRPGVETSTVVSFTP
jgi:hypothetical protein